MENPTKMDDLGVPPFTETPIYLCIVHMVQLNVVVVPVQVASFTNSLWMNVICHLSKKVMNFLGDSWGLKNTWEICIYGYGEGAE